MLIFFVLDTTSTFNAVNQALNKCIMTGLIITGLPASGKGTESEKIAGAYQLVHLDTGERLRQEIENRSEIGREAQKYISKGELVPDSLINKLMNRLLEEQQDQKGVILDGFPRSRHQAEFLEEHPVEVKGMIYLDVSREVIKERMQKRAEETGRKDDKDPQVIQKRIEEQQEQLKEIVAFYRERNKMYTVDGNESIEEVFNSIKEIIEEHDLLHS